jgi:hypothetical protein
VELDLGGRRELRHLGGLERVERGVGGEELGDVRHAAKLAVDSDISIP